jgi:hypothetical protein
MLRKAGDEPDVDLAAAVWADILKQSTRDQLHLFYQYVNTHLIGKNHIDDAAKMINALLNS